MPGRRYYFPIQPADVTSFGSAHHDYQLVTVVEGVHRIEGELQVHAERTAADGLALAESAGLDAEAVTVAEEVDVAARVSTASDGNDANNPTFGIARPR